MKIVYFKMVDEYYLNGDMILGGDGVVFEGFLLVECKFKVYIFFDMFFE